MSDPSKSGVYSVQIKTHKVVLLMSFSKPPRQSENEVIVNSKFFK
jgi:hypothetical protein